MAGFIFRRLLWLIPVLLFTTFATFMLVKAMPGDEIANNPKLSKTAVNNLKKRYGYDKPWYGQYANFVGDAVRGDFGESVRSNSQSVREQIVKAAPISFVIGAAAFVLSAIIGVASGVFGALVSSGNIGSSRGGRRFARILDANFTIITTLAFAIPSFVLAKYAGYWFPESVQFLERSYDPFVLAAPVLVLAIAIVPYHSRIVRSSMLETLQLEFVVAARSKGLPWRKTMMRHVVRNSLIPTVTNAGPMFGFVITGSFVIEYVFNIDGLAWLFTESVKQPIDTRMVLGTTVFLSVIIVVLNILVDIVVGFLDPRITHE